MLGSSDRGSTCRRSGFLGSRIYIGIVRPSRVTRICSTTVPCPWLRLGTRILGMESKLQRRLRRGLRRTLPRTLPRILLGSRHVGASAASRRAVDAWLLGLLSRTVLLAPGHWGPTIGFYGGINYGFGYPGTGYRGGEWRGRDFYYNRAVNNVNITNVHNVYNQTVVNNVTVNRVAYNGGPGGVKAQPTSAQLAAERGRHMDATPVQMHNEQSARSDHSQFASANHGRPAVVATPKPGALNSPEAVRASFPAAHRSANANVNAGPGPRPPQNEQHMRMQQNMPRSQQSTPPEQSAHNVPYPPSHHAQANVPESTQRAENHAQNHVSQPPSHVTNAPPQGSQPQAHQKNAQPRH